MKPSEFARKVFLELWEIHKTKGGSQSSLAAASGIAQGHISVWIKGGINPSLDNLAALAKGFGVPLSTFIPPDEHESAVIRDIVTRIAAFDQDQLGKVLTTVKAFEEIGPAASGKGKKLG